MDAIIPNKNHFRKLSKNDIELQIERVSAMGVSLAAYIKRETCMDELDNRYGTLGWGVSYTPLPTANGLVMACQIEVYDENVPHSTSKMNYGGSNEIKVLATDAFKRACKDWGIGRELNRLGESIIEAYVKVGESQGDYNLNNGVYEFVGKGQGDYIARINIQHNKDTNEFECFDIFTVQEVFYHTEEGKESRIGYLKIFDITTNQVVFVLDELSDLEKNQVRYDEKQRIIDEDKKLTEKISNMGFEGMDLYPDCGPEKIRNKKIIDLSKAEAKAVANNTQDVKIKAAVNRLQTLKGWAN